MRWSGEEVGTARAHAQERCLGMVRNPYSAVVSLVMEIEVMDMFLVTSFELEVAHWFRAWQVLPRSFCREDFARGSPIVRRAWLPCSKCCLQQPPAHTNESSNMAVVVPPAV